MKATLRYTLMGLTFAGLTFLSTSCRKDLCYDHDEHGLSVKVNLSSDWEQEWERTYAYDWEKLWEEDHRLIRWWVRLPVLSILSQIQSWKRLFLKII